MSSSRRNDGYESLDSVDHQQEFYAENKSCVKFKIKGYVPSTTKTFLYHLFGVLFLGIPYFVFNSFSKFKGLKYNKCSLENATVLLVYDSFGKADLVKVQIAKITLPNVGRTPVNVKYFFYQHTKYLWVPEDKIFASLDDLITPLTIDDYLTDTNGLDEADYKNRLDIYGQNRIEVEVKSYWTLFVEEIFNLFYAFQAFSVILWLIDEYVSYALCVIVLTLFSSITSLIQIRRQSEALRNLVESSNCDEVTVSRRKSLSSCCLKKINPIELVPGDLIVLPAANFIMPCDAVLLTGQCIVNESVLTGESVPITKTALHSSTDIYDIDIHKRHTLFSGTHMIQTRYYGGELVLARVVRTGFETTKGSLVKSIMFPTPIGLKFYKDTLKFVFFLFTIAVSGMSYCLYLYISRGADLEDIIIRTLDIITIVVPAALPAAISVGTVYSQNRLKKLGIFCISPPRINLCGKIKIACFDKTGTLTCDGLDMNCVVPCKNMEFSKPIIDVGELDVSSKLVQAMATCHSLTRVDGILNGDPLDLNMFEFTKWELEEPGENENARYDMMAPTVVKPNKTLENNLSYLYNTEFPFQIGIIRQFPFSSTLQCMSVICRELQQSHMVAFTKGAPEKLKGMCLPESIPADFNHRLSLFTAKGYRVIAIAYKDLPVKFKWKDSQKTKRDVIECDLIFLGFLIMQNPLKEETVPVIRTLQEANIRSVMITGDNMLTAISVARECEMVTIHDRVFIVTIENKQSNSLKPRIIWEEAGITSDDDDSISISFDSDNYHLAIDGKTWNMLELFYPEVIPSFLVKTTVFARFQPDQKTQLIHQLQKLDYIVSMVGDGANDCGALKAAHVGVSLSPAEASVAAPFTSSVQNISCLVHLMLEGRCSLVTSMAIFKYMALYSLIQFFSILILYRQHSILGDYQFLFIDLVITTSLAVTIGRQGPSNKLCVKRPMSSLVSPKNTIPLVLQISLCGSIQIAALLYLYQQSWFTPIPSDTVEPVIVSWENLVLFVVSCYQYIILATVYSKGPPYRKRITSNFWFLFSALLLTVSITWMLIYPCKEFAKLMDLEYVDPHNHEKFHFKCTLLAFPLAHFILAVLIEVGISDRKWLKKCIQFLRCKRNPKNKYKVLLKENAYLSWIDVDTV